MSLEKYHQVIGKKLENIRDAKDDYNLSYGSNMNLMQIRERCGNSWRRVKEWTMCKAIKVVFDRPSSILNGGVANLVEDPASKVFGVLFEINSSKCLQLCEVYLNVYDRKELFVFVPDLGRELKAVAYIRTEPESIAKTSEGYLNTIIEGAKENCLPEDWIALLEKL